MRYFLTLLILSHMLLAACGGMENPKTETSERRLILQSPDCTLQPSGYVFLEQGGTQCLGELDAGDHRINVEVRSNPYFAPVIGQVECLYPDGTDALIYGESATTRRVFVYQIGEILQFDTQACLPSSKLLILSPNMFGVPQIPTYHPVLVGVTAS